MDSIGLVMSGQSRHTRYVGQSERHTKDLETWLNGGGARYLDQFAGSMANVVGVIDHDLIVRYLNWTVSGVATETVVGQGALNLIPPHDRENAHEKFQTTLATGQPSQFEMTYKSDEGFLVFVVRASPIVVDGNVVGALTITTDVTEERRERLDRERFFVLSLDMLTVITEDATLKRLNPAFGQAIGYAVSEIAGRPFLDFVHPEDREASRVAFEKVLARVPMDEFENRLCRKDGAYRIFSWRAIVDPVTRDVYAVARDVTAHRTTESQLRHAQKMEAVGQLAGGVAHDFNNLMQAVVTNVELAQSYSGLPGDVIECLEDIGAAGERAAELTKQLLFISRQKPVDPAPIDLRDLILAIEGLLRRLLPENIEIEMQLSEDLPSVCGDRGQIEQVLINLCVNARDAMELGGKIVVQATSVDVSEDACKPSASARPGRFVCLSVRDSGVGMRPEVRERVFEPFFTTKGHKSGTGLGLATVYGVVEQHGGLVDVVSTEGEGTTFFVYLPEDGRAPRVSDRAVPDRLGKGSGTIVIAEDEERVRKPVVQFLESAGYRVLCAENGQEAISLLQRHSAEVDLVILDIVMPVLGGPEAWAKMRQMAPTLQVIFTSGYADAKYRNRLPDGTEVLDKPFRLSDLLRRVQKVTTSSARAE